MLISALQTRGIFCSHCRPTERTIAVGILALRDLGLVGQTVELIQTENPEGDTGSAYTSERYRVRVPQIKFNPDYNVILERV